MVSTLKFCLMLTVFIVPFSSIMTIIVGPIVVRTFVKDKTYSLTNLYSQQLTRTNTHTHTHIQCIHKQI